MDYVIEPKHDRPIDRYWTYSMRFLQEKIEASKMADLGTLSEVASGH